MLLSRYEERGISNMKAPLQLVNRVLVCEYNHYNHPVLRRILRRHGYAVTIASSLAETLQIFATRRARAFKLILVDVIPAENRMEWVNAVRQTQPDIRVLATSAYLGDGFVPPANIAYVPKPFSSQELADAVAKAMTPHFVAEAVANAMGRIDAMVGRVAA
jgi:two-component system cell cycle sensor histidine kinase/response regulator CckA